MTYVYHFITYLLTYLRCWAYRGWCTLQIFGKQKLRYNNYIL